MGDSDSSCGRSALWRIEQRLEQVETHAANHHLVFTGCTSADDLEPARGGRRQHPSVIGDDEVDAAEAFAAAVGCLDKAHACVFQRHFETILRILAQWKLDDA